MHEWMRDFCHYHGFQLNVNKCKYIISDYQGESDTRFLWSVDGKQKIVPYGSSTTFRYLGLFLNMDLQWDRQFQVLTKMVMDWRWKAFSGKVDTAQLRASVVEYLFPRMEIGMLHSDITQQMCDALLSTIVNTLCERGICQVHIISTNKASVCWPRSLTFGFVHRHREPLIFL